MGFVFIPVYLAFSIRSLDVGGRIKVAELDVDAIELAKVVEPKAACVDGHSDGAMNIEGL
jgi:hypothetical protein